VPLRKPQVQNLSILGIMNTTYSIASAT
jgi:hypothetical protein